MTTRMTTLTTSRQVAHSRRVRAPGFGIAGAVLLWLGASSFGDTPDTRDTTAAVAHYFTTNRTNVLLGAVLFGAGLLCLLAVSSRVAAQLRSAGQPGIGRFAHSAATLAVAILLETVVLIDAALSYVIGAEAPDTAKGLFELTLIATPIAGLALAASTGAITIGLVRSGSGRHWFCALTGAAAVVFAMTACSFATSGPFSPDVQQQVLLTVLVAWLAASRRGPRSLPGR